MSIADLTLFSHNYDETGRTQVYALDAMRCMADAELESKQAPLESLETYLSLARRKTGNLYGLVGRLAGIISTKIISDKDLCVSALQMIGVSRQMFDDFVDAAPTQQNSIFVSQDAEEKNRRCSIYRLMDYGFTLNQLKKFHEQYSYKAIQSLNNCLHDGLEKPVIISLCEQVCFGSSSVPSYKESVG